MSSSPVSSAVAEWWPVPGVSATGTDVPRRVSDVTNAFIEGADIADLGSQIVGLRELIDQLESIWTSAVSDFEAQNGPVVEGAGSTAAWLRDRCRLSPGDAATRVRIADAVRGPLSATGEAMSEGRISWRHADVICRTVNDVPSHHRAEVERVLLEPANALDPLVLKRLGQKVLHSLDIEDAERAAVRRLERRGLSMAETLDGMVSISGLLDPIAGASVLSAAHSLVKPPCKSGFDAGDERTWPQRRADALAEICRHFLDSGDAPDKGGVRPHVSVIVDAATLDKASGCAAADVDGIGPITAEEVRMLSCDAAVSRVVMDGPSQVLDVGRTTRTIPPPLRRAVTARDRGCVADGCHRAAQLCDIHHIRFWADGGETSIDNLVMLCRRHHGYVHQRNWRVKLLDDGSRRLVPR